MKYKAEYFLKTKVNYTSEINNEFEHNFLNLNTTQ